MKTVEDSDLPQTIKDQAKLSQHCNAAVIAMRTKDRGTATVEAEEFRKGAEVMKDQASIGGAHALAGQLVLATKRYDKALAELQQADQLSPYNLYMISLAYMGMGDKTKAKECCMKAAHSYMIPTLDYAFIRSKAEKMLAKM